MNLPSHLFMYFVPCFGLLVCVNVGCKCIAIRFLESKQWQEKSVGDSTAEFVRLEKAIAATTSPPEGSENGSSGNTDGSSSQHWRQLIREFRNEALKDYVRFSGRIFPSGTSSCDQIFLSNFFQVFYGFSSFFYSIYGWFGYKEIFLGCDVRGFEAFFTK